MFVSNDILTLKLVTELIFNSICLLNITTATTTTVAESHCEYVRVFLYVCLYVFISTATGCSRQHRHTHILFIYLYLNTCIYMYIHKYMYICICICSYLFCLNCANFCWQIWSVSGFSTCHHCVYVTIKYYMNVDILNYLYAVAHTIQVSAYINMHVCFYLYIIHICLYSLSCKD